MQLPKNILLLLLPLFLQSLAVPVPGPADTLTHRDTPSKIGGRSSDFAGGLPTGPAPRSADDTGDSAGDAAADKKKRSTPTRTLNNRQGPGGHGGHGGFPTGGGPPPGFTGGPGDGQPPFGGPQGGPGGHGHDG
ncbi:hypothetical protein MMC10_004943 [Thelotrema lepadinum]|nr:hypothetical protein [Thelotrema lepadinum]